MIENILYEIDNAFNESENNVLEAIQESCYKALEILENTDDDRDVECFGVFQEAAATATMEKTKTKTDKSTNKDENTDTTNKEEDQKIEKIVTINPRALAAAEKFKADKKKRVEENLSKLTVVKKNKIEKIQKCFKAILKYLNSKYVKTIIEFRDVVLPKYIKSLIKEFKAIVEKHKHVQESAVDDKPSNITNTDIDRIMDEICNDISSTKNIHGSRMENLAKMVVEKEFTTESGIDITSIEKLIEELGKLYVEVEIGYNNDINACKKYTKETELLLVKIKDAMTRLIKEKSEAQGSKAELNNFGKVQDLATKARYDYRYKQHASSTSEFDKAGDAFRDTFSGDVGKKEGVEETAGHAWQGIKLWLFEVIKEANIICGRVMGYYEPPYTINELTGGEKELKKAIPAAGKKIWDDIIIENLQRLISVSISIIKLGFAITATTTTMAPGIGIAVGGVIKWLLKRGAKLSFSSTCKLLFHGFIEKFSYHLKPYAEEADKIIKEIGSNMPPMKGE